MTTDEIKRHYSMREIVERYGLRVNRAGFCSCPFHKGDRTASLKVYKDSYHCFGCGANGDVFTFVQSIDNCDFKTAFISLGGEYETLSDQERDEARAKREREKLARELAERQENDFKNILSECINLARTSIEEDQPYSDRWCLSHNYLVKFLHWWETKFINGEEVSRLSVYRKCEEFRQIYDSSRTDNEGITFA